MQLLIGLGPLIEAVNESWLAPNSARDFQPLSPLRSSTRCEQGADTRMEGNGAHESVFRGGRPTTLMIAFLKYSYDNVRFG